MGRVEPFRSHRPDPEGAPTGAAGGLGCGEEPGGSGTGSGSCCANAGAVAASAASSTTAAADDRTPANAYGAPCTWALNLAEKKSNIAGSGSRSSGSSSSISKSWSTCASTALPRSSTIAPPGQS